MPPIGLVFSGRKSGEPANCCDWLPQLGVACCALDVLGSPPGVADVFTTGALTVYAVQQRAEADDAALWVLTSAVESCDTVSSICSDVLKFICKSTLLLSSAAAMTTQRVASAISGCAPLDATGSLQAAQSLDNLGNSRSIALESTSCVVDSHDDCVVLHSSFSAHCKSTTKLGVFGSVTSSPPSSLFEHAPPLAAFCSTANCGVSFFSRVGVAACSRSNDISNDLQARGGKWTPCLLL